ncbi:MAG: hypothetical protein WBD46_00430, partial [Acidobacteriaceae bacterium]
MRAVWIGALSFAFLGAAFAQQQPNVPDAPAPQAQNTAPNAPAPQPGANGLPDLKDQVTPGRGTGAADDQANPGSSSTQPPSQQTAPAPAQEGPPPGYV